MDKQPNEARDEPEQTSTPAEQKPEAIADEQLDDVAGGLLTWGNGESFGGGGGPVGKPRRP